MTERNSNEPRFAGPPGGTCTRLCKRPELARERLELGGLRANPSGSKPSGEDWTYSVSAKIEAGSETMALELPARVALGFGLNLLEGAAFCYLPKAGLGAAGEREARALPVGEELRLLGLAARASMQRTAETTAELAWLRELVGRTSPGQWAVVDRHETRLDVLRRAGLVEVQGFGVMTRARATDEGRALVAMLGGAP